MGKEILTTVLTVTIAVICVATILVPTLSDVTKTEETFDNTDYGYYQMKELETGDSWTRNGTTWTYGGVEITNSTNENVSMIATDNLVVRQNGFLRGTTIGNNNTSAVDVVSVDDLDYLSINSGSNVSYSTGFGATQNGDYILKTYADTAYVHGDTNLWVTGVTGFTDASSLGNIIIHIEGTIDDGVTITATPISGGTTDNIVAGEPTINYTQVNGYEDLYLLTSVEFDLTADYTADDTTTEVSTTATYSTFILPKEVTAELSQHLTDAQNNIIMVIPVLMICAILITAFGMLYFRNKD